MLNRVLASILTLAIIISLNITASAEDNNHFSNSSAEDNNHFSNSSAELFTEKESEYADLTAAAAMNMEESFSFPEPVSEREFSRIMNIVYNNFPELFHLNSSYSYIPGTDPATGEGTVTKVLFKYTMSPEEYASAKEEMKSWSDSIIALGDEDLTHEQWSLLFHDYLDSQYSYDYSYSYNTAYELVRYGSSVCRGYHLAYMYLLRAIGIECSLAISAEMNHVWTMVNINGNWHHVDATWDDGMNGAWGRATHNYFLLCDHVISDEEGRHYGWIAKYTASCHNHTRDDLDFSDTSFVYGGGKWYYLHDGVLSRTDDPHSPGEDVLDLGLKWHTWGDSGSTFVGTFSGIIFYNGDVLFNGENNLYAYDTVTKAVRILWENDRDDGYIFGFKKIGNEIHMDITTSPTTEGTDVIVNPFIPETGVVGDTNGDGRQNLNDASSLMKYTAGWSVGISKSSGDLTGDGKLNLMDVAMLMKILAGWEV